MYRDHTVGVVVPAYNEAGFIGDVIREMPAYVDVIYTVDDCSTDGTWEEIIEAARTDAAVDGEGQDDPGGGPDPDSEPDSDSNSDRDDGPQPPEAHEQVAPDGGASMLEQRATVHEPVGRVTPIQHEENLGAGGAIKTGYLAALEDGVDVTVTVDGDGQMDLSQMSRLLDPIVEGEADYAKGNRLLYREFRTAMPTFRFVGNAILTFLTKIASGYWKTMDPQNGYTAISGYALENVGIESMYEYYGYCNDLLVKLNAKGMRVADVAMPAVYGDEESSITYTTYIRKVSWLLLRDFLWRLKTKYLVLDFNPLAFFYFIGAATTVVGLLGGCWSLYARFALGDPLFVRAAASLMLFLLGSLFLLFAMLFDMQANENKEVQVHG